VIGFTQIRQNRIRNRSDIVVVGLSPCHRAFSPKTFSNIGTNLRGVIVATAGDAAPALDARRWIDARAAAHMRKLYLLPVTTIKIRSECGSKILLERGRGVFRAMEILNSHLPSVTPLKNVLYFMIVNFRFLQHGGGFRKPYLRSTHCIDSNIEVPGLTQGIGCSHGTLIAVIAAGKRFCSRTFINNHER
jgi:hypothetical protein